MSDMDLGDDLSSMPLNDNGVYFSNTTEATDFAVIGIAAIFHVIQKTTNRMKYVFAQNDSPELIMTTV